MADNNSRNNHVTLKFREKLGYGFGDAASSMYWKIFSMYLLFFYTDVFGISAAAVGTMFLITRVWDALNDPLMGIISDRTNTKWGKFRPYILFGGIPLAIMGVLTFSTPTLNQGGKLVYAYITYTLMMMTYTAVNVPYSSLLGVMSPKMNDRTILASYRFVFAFGGSILALASVQSLVELFSSGHGKSVDNTFGWQMTMGFYGCLAILFFLLTFFWTREKIKPLLNQKSSLRKDLKDLGRNIPWFVLLGAAIATLIFNSIRDGSIMYYFKYYVTDNKALNLMKTTVTYSTLFMVLGQVGNIIGVVLAKPVSGKLGKKHTFFLSMIIASVLSFIFFMFPPSFLFLIYLFQFIISISAGIIFPLLWSMYGDIADYSEWKNGRRATGLIFSSSSMSQKFGWTLGGAATGWFLAIYGFRANVEQSAETLKGIRIMMSILPGIAALMSAFFIYFYKLSDSYMKTIIDDLERKRKQ